MAPHSADFEAIPFDVIFSCTICQRTITEIYDEPEHRADVNAETDTSTNRLWLTDCGHLTCSDHLDGGGAPFHPDDQKPKAICPYCKSQSNDNTPRTLYYLRGSEHGQHDPNLPKEFFDTPPVRLDQKSPGMVALRFQYMSLVRFATSTATTLARARVEMRRLQSQAGRADKKEQDSNTNVQRLHTRILELETCEAELRLWRQRERKILHYLGVFTALTKENANLREQLLAFGYTTPTKSYVYDPNMEPSQTENPGLSDVLPLGMHVVEAEESAQDTLRTPSNTDIRIHRNLSSGHHHPRSQAEDHLAKHSADAQPRPAKRLKGSDSISARRLSQPDQDREMMPPPPLPNGRYYQSYDNSPRSHEEQRSLSQITQDMYKRQSRLPMASWDANENIENHINSPGRNKIPTWQTTIIKENSNPRTSEGRLNIEDRFQDMGRRLLNDPLNQLHTPGNEERLVDRSECVMAAPSRQNHRQEFHEDLPHNRNDEQSQNSRDNGKLYSCGNRSNEHHDTAATAAATRVPIRRTGLPGIKDMPTASPRAGYRFERTHVLPQDRMLATGHVGRGPVTPSPHKRRLLTAQSVTSPFFRSTGAPQHKGSMRLPRRYSSSSGQLSTNRAVLAPLQSPIRRQANRQAPTRHADLNSLSFVTEPHHSRSHQPLMARREATVRESDVPYLQHNPRADFIPITPRNADGLFERRSGFQTTSQQVPLRRQGRDYAADVPSQPLPWSGQHMPESNTTRRELQLGDLLGMKRGMTASQEYGSKYLVSADGRRSVRR